MKEWIVGGTFDEAGGKPSKIVSEISSNLNMQALNGGSIEALRTFDLTKPDVLIWMPNVDNTEEKILPTIKTLNPKVLLISSKRVVEKDYTESDIVGRLLKTKSNLGIMIVKDLDRYRFNLLDPLGNMWASDTNIATFCSHLRNRITELLSVTRIPSVRLGEIRQFEINQDFIKLVREFGTEFTKYVNAINPNRFLGNAATRCSYGFPSVKDDDRIFVTRRNVDKEGLSPSDFVEIESLANKIGFYGSAKPSVDAPIQIKLFEYYKNVRFMLHGHVYVTGYNKTISKLPCGSIEEFDEIVNHIPAANSTDFVMNLTGHGFLALASSLDFLKEIKNQLIGRPFPETHIVH